METMEIEIRDHLFNSTVVWETAEKNCPPSYKLGKLLDSRINHKTKGSYIVFEIIRLKEKPNLKKDPQYISLVDKPNGPTPPKLRQLTEGEMAPVNPEIMDYVETGSGIFVIVIFVIIAILIFIK